MNQLSNNDEKQQLEQTFQVQNDQQQIDTKSQVPPEGNTDQQVNQQQQQNNSEVIQNENKQEAQKQQSQSVISDKKPQEEQKTNSSKLIDEEKKTIQNQDNPKQTDRKSTKRRTTKKQTTKVDFQEPTETKEIQQNEQTVEQTEQTEPAKPTQQEVEQQQKEEEQKRLQEQQEQLQKSQLKEKFYKDLIYPRKKKQKKEKPYDTLRISFQREESVPRRKCKSEIKFRNDKKPRSSVIQDLIDFYNKMNPEKPKVENTEEVEKYKQLNQLQKDLENFEQQLQVQVYEQHSSSQPQKPKRKLSKQRSSTQPKKKVELIIVHKQVRKVKVRNGLKDRMKIDKDRDKQLAALEFVKKMQQSRVDAEKKRQEQVVSIGNKIAEEIEVIRLGNRAYREEVQQKKRKEALEKITKHEQKRYEQMMKQEQNEKFVRELREKAAALGHYSAKKLISPSSLITELENGGIAIEQQIDSYRKLNENQFVLLEEQKNQKKLNKKKQIEYGKQVSLFHLPKIGVQKKSPKEYPNEPLPEIKPKQKKAWQIEQELNQKKQQHYHQETDS